jgi:hypothetical protein
MSKFNSSMTREAATRHALAKIRTSPRLYRTSSLGIAEKPLYCQGGQWSAFMKENFPAWSYNGQKRHWQGPLTDLSKMVKMFPNAIQSDGVKDYLGANYDNIK